MLFRSVEDAGANASAEALGLRSNADYRTRDLKIQSWKKSLRDLVQLMLALDSLDGMAVTQTFDDIDIQINFYDPANFQVGTPSIQQKLETMKIAYDSGLIDLEGALQYIWSDSMSEEEIEQLILKLQTQTKKEPEVKEEEQPPQPQEEDIIEEEEKEDVE